MRERFCYLFILLFFKYVVYLKYRILKSEFSCLVEAIYFAILNKLRAQKIINLVTVVFSIKLNLILVVNAGDPVPFIPPVPSIPYMTDAYYHVGFGLTLHNSPTAESSDQLETGLHSFIERVLSPDWFHRKKITSIKNIHFQNLRLR